MSQKPRKINTVKSANLAVLVTAIMTSSLQAEPSQAVMDGMTRLQNATTGQAAISLDPATELASFVRFSPGGLRRAVTRGATADEKTREFLSEHESAFGLREHASELITTRQGTDAYGRKQVRYRQVYEGIPVFGAELSSHFDRNGELRALSASTIEIGSLDTTPLR